ncbi:MAG TPA: SDR family oxidoreductase [Gemmatimonadaceae bacterium]|nr:SDR family oxidoreductase [Gemmatimonadaceae bacterium]
MTILVTGATGYIGGRLAARLLADGRRVRALARDPRRLTSLAAAGAECVAGDVLRPESLPDALAGVEVAYYLIHSMGMGRDFAARDREAAANFATACAAAGVRRIIYLGGLGQSAAALSTHLASRQEVGDVLRGGPVPVTELRAAIIVGAGSASFEIIRDLARKLPVMICPRWVRSRCEPIALDQVLDYLVGVLDEPRTIGEVLEIGGGEVLTYQDMMRQCAAALGKRVRIITVPVLTPRLSSYWLNLVTAVPMSIARPLVEGLRHDVVTTDQRIRAWIPVEAVSFRQSVERALAEDHAGPLASRWTGAAGRVTPGAATRAILRDDRMVPAKASAAELFAVVERIGGTAGWFYANWLWRARGAIDRLLGGVGMRRGRRHPLRVVAGDPIDFWRVEEIVPGQRLRLRAEMKVPGTATLEFEVLARGHGEGAFLIQRAEFEPHSRWGRAYWTALRPLHALVFRGMAAGIVDAAESGHGAPHPRTRGDARQSSR